MTNPETDTEEVLFYICCACNCGKGRGKSGLRHDTGIEPHLLEAYIIKGVEDGLIIGTPNSHSDVIYFTTDKGRERIKIFERSYK